MVFKVRALWQACAIAGACMLKLEEIRGVGKETEEVCSSVPGCTVFTAALVFVVKAKEHEAVRGDKGFPSCGRLIAVEGGLAFVACGYPIHVTRCAAGGRVDGVRVRIGDECAAPLQREETCTLGRFMFKVAQMSGDAPVGEQYEFLASHHGDAELRDGLRFYQKSLGDPLNGWPLYR